MDPAECLRDILQGTTSDRENTVEAAKNLLLWMLAGGFVPMNTMEERGKISKVLGEVADHLENNM